MNRQELIAAVPVHEIDGRPYFVALREIPQPWREQFTAALYGCACPVFEEHGPSAFFADWDTWVRSTKRGPQGLK